jgi:hypothetical protein
MSCQHQSISARQECVPSVTRILNFFFKRSRKERTLFFSVRLAIFKRWRLVQMALKEPGPNTTYL